MYSFIYVYMYIYIYIHISTLIMGASCVSCVQVKSHPSHKLTEQKMWKKADWDNRTDMIW